MAILEHCEQLKSELLSDKLAKRKEGLKHLNQILDSEALLRALDEATLRILPTDRQVLVNTWPGLCTILVQCIAKELGTSSGKKRGPDATVSKTFRRFVQTADDERRSGRSGMLGRRAAKLFAHVKDVLNRAGPASAIGADYSSVLRSNLLANAQYCSLVPASTFQELLSVYLGKLEDSPLDRSEDTYRTISMVHLLLQSFKGDMEPAFRADMIVFLCDIFPKLHDLREDSRVSIAFVAAMNTFLLANGLDVSSKTAELHAAVHPFLMRSWRSARDARLREALVLYLRIQLLLGGLEAPGDGHFLEEVQELLTHSMQEPGFSWCGEARGRGCAPTKQQLALLEVTSTMHFKIMLQHKTAGFPTSDSRESSAKRRKVSSPQQQLVEQLLMSPQLWAPVFALLLRRHGHQVDKDCYAAWLQLLKEPFEETLLAGKASDLDIMWLLRCTAELAAAWPDTCEPPPLSSSSGFSSCVRGHWQVIWDALVRWLSQSEALKSHEAVSARDAAIFALAIMYRRDLARSTASGSSLFRLPVLQQTFPLSTLLIGSRFAKGYRGGAEEVALRTMLLEMVLGDMAFSTSPCLLYCSIADILDLQSEENWTEALHECGLRMWWHQEDSTDQNLASLTRGVDFVIQRMLGTQPAAQQVASGTQKMPDSVAARLQNVAGARLVALLGKLTEDTDAKDEAHLQALLGLCTVALRCNAAVLGDVHGNDGQIESSWKEGGSLERAFRKCSSLLVTLVDSRSCVTGSTYRLLEDMAAALTCVPWSQLLASPWLGAVHELERLFNDADQASAALLSSQPQSAAGHSSADNAPASLFDDDLDLQATAVAAANGRPSSAAPRSSATLVAACRSTCVQLLAVLGSLHPQAAAGILGTSLEHCFNAEIAPSEGLTELIAEKLCIVAAASRLPKLMQTAASGLDAHTGLLLPKRFHNSTICLVLQQLQSLVQAFGNMMQDTSAAPSIQEAEQCFQSFLLALESVLDLMVQADDRSDTKSQTCSTTRIALAEAVVTMLGTVEVSKLQPELLDECLEHLATLLQDQSYAARRRGASIIPLLFGKWSDVQAMFDNFKPRLCLHSLATAPAQRSEEQRSGEHMETSALFVAESAIACGALEVEALFLLCAHAAKHPQQQPLVQALLQCIGQRLGYASLPAYISNHMVQLVFLWFGHKYHLQQLLNIQELIRVQEGNTLNQKALLSSYSRALVPAMLMDNREEELREMAALLAVDVRKLLERNMDAIVGMTFPLTRTGEDSDKALARSMLEENIMAAVFTGDERNKLFGDKIIYIIGQCLLLVRECAHPPKPFITVALGIESIYSLPSCTSREECKKILWSQILSDDAVAKLLLMVHMNLQKGRCARHKLEALGPLKALLIILDDHVCAAHTFRHVVHMLLQCLRVRELQEKCCRMLEDVLERIQSRPELHPLLGALLPTIISGTVTALETTHAPTNLSSGTSQGLSQNSAAHNSSAQHNKLLSLINTLILQALPDLHPYLQHVEPLPDMPELARAQQLLDTLRSGVSLSAEMTYFVSRAAALPNVLLQRALASLDRGLTTRQAELMAHDGQCKPEVRLAAWQLVWLARDLGNSNLAAFAGKLLALVGPLEPHVIAFSIPSQAATSSAAVDRTPSAQNDRSSRGGARAASKADSLQMILAEALQLLIVYLVDEDVPFIQTAHVTLRQLLSTPQGLAALQQLEPLQQSYIQIFAGPKRAAVSPEPGTRFDLGDSRLWQLEGQTYEQWVCGLADALLGHSSNPLLRILQRCARKKSAMAELLLPHIFADLAAHDADASLMATISEQVSMHIIQAASTDVKAVRLSLNVLDFLRSERQDFVLSGRPQGQRGRSGQTGGDPTLWRKVCWLDLNYLHLAQAALRCSAAFTALLYIEYWCKEHYGRLTLGEEDLLSEGEISNVDQLLLDIYSQVQEPDSIYAAARSQKAASQLCLFEHEGAWDKALVGYDLLQLGGQLPQQPAARQSGILNSLQQLGCQYTLRAYCATLPPQSQSGSRALWEKRFETAWRMGDWQEAAVLQALLPDAGEGAPFHQAICSCLKALKDEDHDTLQSTLHAARASIVQELTSISTESAASINPAVVRLQMLHSFVEASELCGSAASQRTACGRDRQTAVFALGEKWGRRSVSAMGTSGRYELLEPLLSLQRTLASALDLPDVAASMVLLRARMARKNGRLTHAMGSLHDLQIALRSGAAGEHGHVNWRMEEAKLLWAQEQHSMAIRLGQALLQKMKGASFEDTEELTRLQSLLGKWLAWNRSDSSAAVLDMMQQALQRVSTSQTPLQGKVACRAAYRLAHYADSMYCQVQQQRSSPEWATAQAVIQQKMQQMAEWQAQFDERRRRGDMKISPDGTVQDKESRQLWHHINSLRRPVEADKQEQAALAANELKYRDLAMSNYRRCLLAGDAYNLPVIFRLCQLWFSLGADFKVAEQMAKAAGEVPSWKFMPLVYQLASRLSCGGRSRPLDDSGFTATLTALMERLASDHPHHTLHCLMALKNGNRGRDGRRVDATARASRDALVHSIDFDKVAAAENVLNNVARKPALKEIVAQVGLIAEAYIELAAVPAPDKANEMPFPSHLRRSTKALNKVPVVSVSIPVDPSCTYAGLACFSHFGEGITFVGGINKPKLVQCFDSTGMRHRQLVKSGNDDLRQDAVMQQFFSLINDLLAQSVETRKRCLNIVTYKVVPFSPAAGLLEWVEDTEPLGTYLTGKERTSGAHARYARPSDYSFFDAYNIITKCKPQNLRKAFDDVCARFTPCLHNFFLENFRQPAAWFEKRLAYTRATAVNSMAGYLIGLGDRHFHNILIDKRSAEVVHIDLGVAFEQGRFLNTPELVPFRLTRDVVDGMGATGVEGVMRKCCEETLRVLRVHKESLLTIVEVFIHDPLYRWALTPANAQQRQVSSLGDASSQELGQPLNEGGDGLANADAKRTLLRVKQKLEGLDGGEGEAKTVEGQVQRLLQEAQDPDRLCRMFVGWAPWL
ncbi:Serine-protein kinase ATM [Coccomyxa sp. Obi]|nr:Serine-protein kinase ATM [Coccomyxa sp. Obi]